MAENKVVYIDIDKVIASRAKGKRTDNNKQ